MENLKSGDIVYHVAHPNVKGVVVAESKHKLFSKDSWVPVKFSEPVTFSGYPGRKLSLNWECSSNLLFSSPEEARANRNPKKA